MTPEDIEEMKALVAVARKRPLAFGLCLGKRPEGLVFVMHRTKDGDVLARAAKRDGETAKVAYGTVELKGKRLTLTCQADVVPGMSKQLRRFLKEHDLPLKVIALDASGSLADDDGEEDLPGGDEAEDAGATTPVAADEEALAQRWAGVEAAISPLVARATEMGVEKAAQFAAVWKAARDAAAQGRYEQAITAGERLRPMLGAVVQASGNGAAREVPADVVPFQKSRILWGATRNTMRNEMAKLESAIVAACAGDPDLAPIAAATSDLRRRLDGFDVRLEEVLDRIAVTAEGEERRKLKGQAARLLDAYSGLLDEDFFRDVDTANGFVPVKVAESARKALDAIRKVVA